MKKRFDKGEHLVYNENTKLLTMEIVPDKKFKLFLEKNKIYFETILMFILTVAGIIVSVISVHVGVTANNILLEEKRIDNLEKQPAFAYSAEKSGNEVICTVKNIGGDIKYGSAFCEEVLIVTVYNDDYSYLGKGYIVLDNYFEKNFSMYDFKTNSFDFSIISEVKHIDKLMPEIENTLITEGFYYGTEFTTCFDFTYKDYKLDEIHKTMRLKGADFCDIEKSDNYEFLLYVNMDNLEDENIASDLKSELDLLVKFNHDYGIGDLLQ